MNAEEKRHKIKKYLEPMPDISAAYLFGSAAKGTQRAGSDIDIAVIFTSQYKNKFERFERRLDLEIELEKITGKAVDVVDLEMAPPVLQHQVRKHGILLFEKDRRLRVAFEVASRRRYFDMLRVYKRRSEALFKSLGG